MQSRRVSELRDIALRSYALRLNASEWEAKQVGNFCPLVFMSFVADLEMPLFCNSG